nr:YdbH domain-containing protein [Marivibrio halodurans]
MALILGGLWAARVPVAQSIAPPLAGEVLGTPVSFTVAQIGPGGIVLNDIALGPAGAEERPTARRVEIGFDPLAPALTTLSVAGLRARIGTDSDGTPTVAGLPPDLFDGRAEGDARASTLPWARLPTRIALEDLGLTVETPAGAHRIAGRAALSRPAGDALLPLSVEADLRDADGGGTVDIAVSARPDGIDATGGGRIDLAVWHPLLPGLDAAEGSVHFTLDVRGAPFDPADPPTDLAALAAALDGGLTLTPDGVRLRPTGLTPIALSDTPVDLTMGGKGVSAALPPGFEATMAEAPTALVAVIRPVLPDTTPSPIRLAVPGGQAVRLSLSPMGEGGWGIATDGALMLAAGPARVTGAPTATLSGDGTLDATLKAGWTARLEPLPLPQGTALRRPLEIEGTGPLTLRLPPDSTSPTVTARAAITDLALTGPEETAVDLALPNIRLDMKEGRLTLALSGAAIRHPDNATSVRDLAARIAGPVAGPYDLTLSAPSIDRDGQAILRGDPVLNAHIESTEGGGWRGGGDLSLLGGQVIATFRALLTADGAPTFAMDMPPVTFTPDGPTPAMLSAMAEGIAEDVAGTLALDADLSFGADGPAGDVALTVDGVSLSASLARITDLTGTVRFDAARAPATLARQRLDARLSVAGMDPVGLSLLFSLDERARLLIDRLVLETLDGRVLLRDARYDPLADQFEGRIDLETLDLSRALGALDVEGVAGTGTLDGGFTLTVAPGADADAPPRIRISDGAVRTTGPGTLAIDNPAIGDYLSGRNQAVDLMIEALKDFRYDRLSADLSLTPDGAAVLALSLFGRNPAVLDGQPFDVNLSVETDITDLVESLGTVFNATDSLLERLARQAR